MDLKHLVILAFQVSILCTVFGFGLKTTTDDLLYLMRRPGLLLRSLLAVFVVMPVFAVLLVQLFDFRPVVKVGLVALAISPVPPLLPQRETRAGGSSSYALALMTVLSVLAIVMVPLSVEILQRVFGRPLSTEPGTIARLVLMTAILPLATGMAVRANLPRLAASIEKPVALAAKILLPLAALVLIGSAAPAIWATTGDGTLLAMLLFLAVGFAVGHALGGPDPDQSVVLALSTACRHPAIALSIASANFPGEHVGAGILLYLILGVIAGMPYVAWQRRQMQTAPRAT